LSILFKYNDAILEKLFFILLNYNQKQIQTGDKNMLFIWCAAC